MAIKREKVIRSAERYVSKGKLEAAINEYRKVLAENPTDANTLNRVGDLYARIERYDEAVKLFSQIAEQYTRDGFLVKAIAIYKKIIKLDPTTLQVYEKLAELYHRQGLLNEARTQYQVLADYYHRHDNPASAITIYQKMVEVDTQNPALHLRLAELYESQQLHEKAVREYSALAQMLVDNDSVEEAGQVYIRAVEINPQNLALVRDVVVGLRDGGHVETATKVLSRAEQLNPEAITIGRLLRADGALDDDESKAEEVAPEPEAAELAPPEAELESTMSTEGWAAPEPEDGPESGVFTLDLDDDEIPESLVQPPPDLASPDSGSAEDLEQELENLEKSQVLDLDDTLSGPEPEVSFELDLDAGLETELELGTDIEIDLDLDLELEASEPTAPVIPAERRTVVEASGLDESDSTVPAPGAFAEAANNPAVEGGDEIEWSLEELADLEVPAVASDIDAGATVEPATGGVAKPKTSAFELSDPDLAEDSVADSSDPESTPAHHCEDLLAEAQVFAKYGLLEKAQGRLGELLDLAPDHLEGRALLATVELESGAHDQVFVHATEVARLAGESGEVEVWEALRGKLLRAGYQIDGNKLLGGPDKTASEDNRIAALLEDLDIEAPPSVNDSQVLDLDDLAAARALADSEPPSGEEQAVAAPSESLSEPPSGTLPEPPPEPQSEVREPAFEVSPTEAEDKLPEAPAAETPSAQPENQLFSLADELDLEHLDDELDDVLSGQKAAQEAKEALDRVDPLDETGLSWLDDTGGASTGQDASEDSLFEEEDDFFDLAAELERELTEDQQAGGASPQPEEQSLEEIIDGFKRGVAENLSEEDYDTHFNLGIAYREMGLVDEAIGEFQLASKNERYLVECSSLLALCFLEKGLADLAMKWYRKGLASPAIGKEETLGLLYEMGNAYVSLGDGDSAYKTFVEIYGMNSNFRDIGDRLESLREHQPS